MVCGNWKLIGVPWLTASNTIPRTAGVLQYVSTTSKTTLLITAVDAHTHLYNVQVNFCISPKNIYQQIPNSLKSSWYLKNEIMVLYWLKLSEMIITIDKFKFHKTRTFLQYFTHKHKQLQCNFYVTTEQHQNHFYH